MVKKKLLILLYSFLLCNCSLSAQQFQSKTFQHAGNTREYSLYVPASYQAAIPAPLLFNFHGGSGDIASQIAISDMRSIADSTGLILVYPQAWPDPNDGGSTNWTHKAPATIDDIYFVEAMIDALAMDYSIDADRVYACGYSNGGEFAFELACRLNERIAAIGVVARSMYIETFNQCAPSHPTAVLTIHGTKDEYNGIIFGGITYYIALDDVNEYWAEENNTTNTPTIIPLPNTNPSDGSTVERHIWDNGDGCVSVEHFKVLDGGHDWPGSFGNMDIDASIEIWNFVSKYDRNGLITCGVNTAEPLIASKKIQIYPNPATKNLSIDLDFNDLQTYAIYSAFGQLKASGEIVSSSQTIDVSELSSGVYFLKVNDAVYSFLKME